MKTVQVTRVKLIGILTGVLGLSILGFGIWWFWGRPPAHVSVKTAVVTPLSLREKIHTSGTLNPAVTQDVRALNPGRAVKVAVKEGDNVKSGQMLVQLDPTLANAQVAEAQASLDAAQANREAAQANLDRIQAAARPASGNVLGGLSAPGISASTNIQQAQTTLTQAQSAVKQAQASLQAAQAQRAQLTFTANLTGTVLEVNAQEGNPAPLQDPMVLLADLRTQEVEVQLNEIDAGRTAVGQKAEVTGKVLGNTLLKGSVKEVAPAAVSKTGIQGANAAPTVKVRIALEQLPPVLKPGFSVNVDILTAAKDNVLAISQEAIFQENNQNFVYRVDEGKIHKVQVQLGIADDINQEIISGLRAGEQVVLNPSPQFYEGMPVRVNGSESG